MALSLAYVARRFGHVEDLGWAEEASMDAADEVLASRDLAALRPLVRFIRPVDGHGELVPPDYAAVVSSSQVPDGGWPEKIGDERSDPHATAWGLRCQMELLNSDGLTPTRWVAGS